MTLSPFLFFTVIYHFSVPLHPTGNIFDLPTPHSWGINPTSPRLRMFMLWLSGYVSVCLSVTL